MDVSRFRIGDWVLVGAGVAMLVLGLAVPWVTVTFRGIDLPGARNAFDYPLTGGIAWLLVVAAGVVTFLRAGRLLRGREDAVDPAHRRRAPRSRSSSLVLRLILGPGDYSGAELGRGAGMIIAVLAAVPSRWRRGRQPPGRGRRRSPTCGRSAGAATRATRRASRRPARPPRRRRRPAAAGLIGVAVGRQSFSTRPAISSPASVGLRPTATPAAARASILPWAVPLPPETMAPAWPIFLPAGAVTPAM